MAASLCRAAILRDAALRAAPQDEELGLLFVATISVLMVRRRAKRAVLRLSKDEPWPRVRSGAAKDRGEDRTAPRSMPLFWRATSLLLGARRLSHPRYDRSIRNRPKRRADGLQCSHRNGPPDARPSGIQGWFVSCPYSTSRQRIEECRAMHPPRRPRSSWTRVKATTRAVLRKQEPRGSARAASFETHRCAMLLRMRLMVDLSPRHASSV